VSAVRELGRARQALAFGTLAGRVGCTEGQLYTAVIGLLVAVLLLALSVPSVLRGRQVLAAPTTPAAALGAGTGVPTPAPTPPVGGSLPLPAAPTVPLPAAGVAPAPAPAASAAPAGGSLPPIPRAIVDSGYTSSTAGTPLAGPEVPQDGMPVGVRLGQVDKMSFARLSGSAPQLRLALVTAPGANQLELLAAVRACAVTRSGWTLPGPGAPPADAPSYDAHRCTDGVQQASGVWSFDLSRLGSINPAAGIALLPVAEGPLTFQVTFSTVAV
jgi:hypothetical protein